MNLPRIRFQGKTEEFAYRGILVGYPKEGIGVSIDMYQRMDVDEWMVFPVIAR